MESRVSVSTWALHSLIGQTGMGRPGRPGDALMESRPGDLPLLDVPATLAQAGLRTMELCHFHIPSQSPEYIEMLRKRIEDAEVELWSTLIDDGDIAHPETGARDIKWIQGWIDIAGALGSRCVRVIAGRQPDSPGARERAIAGLSDLADHAALVGVRLLTENWHETLCNPDAVREVLDALGGRVGLCFDYGNWSGPDKYANLARIAEYAASCHAKWDNDEDFRHCTHIVREAGFAGPYTLVYGEPGRVWESLAHQRTLLGL